MPLPDPAAFSSVSNRSSLLHPSQLRRLTTELQELKRLLECAERHGIRWDPVGREVFGIASIGSACDHLADCVAELNRRRFFG